MPYVIGAPRVDVKDRACVDEYFYEGAPMLYLHPDGVPTQEG